MRRKKTREEKGEKREENACIQKEGEMNGGIGFFFFFKMAVRLGGHLYFISQNKKDHLKRRANLPRAGVFL